jgi:hypothetical protein
VTTLEVFYSEALKRMCEKLMNKAAYEHTVSIIPKLDTLLYFLM